MYIYINCLRCLLFVHCSNLVLIWIQLTWNLLKEMMHFTFTSSYKIEEALKANNNIGVLSVQCRTTVRHCVSLTGSEVLLRDHNNLFFERHKLLLLSFRWLQISSRTTRWKVGHVTSSSSSSSSHSCMSAVNRCFLWRLRPSSAAGVGSLLSGGSMELSVTFMSAGLLVVLLWLLILKSCRQMCLPPGPSGLPVIGNLLQLDKRAPFKTLLKVRRHLCICTLLAYLNFLSVHYLISFVYFGFDLNSLCS